MDIIEMINNNNIQGFIDNVAQCMGRIAEIEKALLCNRSFPIFIKLSFIKIGIMRFSSSSLDMDNSQSIKYPFSFGSYPSCES